MSVVISLLTIALMVVAMIDIITRRDDQVKHLPKIAWVILVILLPLFGSVLWFALGRQYDGEGVPLPKFQRPERAPRPQPAPPVETWTPPSRPVDTRSTEQQLADLEREIEEWRLKEEIAKRKKDAEGSREDG